MIIEAFEIVGEIQETENRKACEELYERSKRYKTVVDAILDQRGLGGSP